MRILLLVYFGFNLQQHLLHMIRTFYSALYLTHLLFFVKAESENRGQPPYLKKTD